MKIHPFRLERFFAEWEFEAPYLLCASDAESLRLQELLALEVGAEEEVANLWLGYTETRGDPALREETVGLYDTVKDTDILVAGVLMLPGSVFDEPEHVRFGLGRANFGEGLARLDARLAGR